MTVALLINSVDNAARMIPWGAAFARAENSDLLIVAIRRAKGQRNWKDISPEPNEDSDSPVLKAIREQIGALGLCVFKKGETGNDGPSNADVPTPVYIKELSGPEPGKSLSHEIENLRISKVVIAADEETISEPDETQWQQKLYRNVPCTAIYLRDDTNQKIEGLRILVIVNSAIDDDVALQFATSVAESNQGSVTALYLEPNIDQVASQVGDRNLERIARAALGRGADALNRKVILGENLNEAFKQIQDESYDLILSGRRRNPDVKKTFGLRVASSEGESNIPAVATIRAGVPLSGRVRQKLRRIIGRYVPPLDREQRVNLVSKIQSSSQWDCDFVTLILLSTLIAALGLIQDSGSVVIGAMLVAPLMTPIVATGLGLAQGNQNLMAMGIRTVFRGFATAFVLGMIVGLLVWHDPPGSQITGRGHPNLNDLVIALVSGVAAAYALVRPNLLSALPGVAIAAALVPPLAVSGMAIAVGEFKLGLGALLLFLTNIVLITVGTTITFRAVGVRTDRKGDKPMVTWPRWLMLLLVIVSILLARLMPLVARDEIAERDAVSGAVEAIKSLDVNRDGQLDKAELKPFFDRVSSGSNQPN